MCIEVASLCVEHLDVVDAPRTVLQLGEIDIFFSGVARVGFQRRCLAELAVCHYGVVNFLECGKHLLLIFEA